MVYLYVFKLFLSQSDTFSLGIKTVWISYEIWSISANETTQQYIKQLKLIVPQQVKTVNYFVNVNPSVIK